MTESTLQSRIASLLSNFSYESSVGRGTRRLMPHHITAMTAALVPFIRAEENSPAPTVSVVDNNPRPLIAVDFDLTLCNSAYPQCGDPIPGGREALQRFRDLGYLILIYSCRACKWHYDIFTSVKKQTPVMERATVTMMRDWLVEHDIPFDEIDDGSKGKPYAQFYIDDKGIRFENNWAEVADFVAARTKTESEK